MTYRVAESPQPTEVGFSERQRKTAFNVTNIPRDQFEREDQTPISMRFQVQPTQV